ncbi:MAG: hypothetical protein KDK71_01735 [Chlamydiia bacterium]|nr:hypothetical protein [Chlamydiia bacterium]
MSGQLPKVTHVHHEYPAFYLYKRFDQGLRSTYNASRGVGAVAVAVTGAVVGIFAYPILGLIGCIGSLLVARKVTLTPAEAKESSVTHLFVLENFMGGGIATQLCDAARPLVPKTVTVIPVPEETADDSERFVALDLSQVEQEKKAAVIFVSESQDLFLNTMGHYSSFSVDQLIQDKISRGARVVIGNVSQKLTTITERLDNKTETQRFFDKPKEIAYKLDTNNQEFLIQLLKELGIPTTTERKEEYVFGARTLWAKKS